MFTENGVKIVDHIDGMTSVEVARLVAEAEAGYPIEALGNGERGSAAVLLDLPEDIRGEVIRVCLDSGATPQEVVTQILTEHFFKAA
ncbi:MULTISPECIES: hypothetical protein [unclassified Corynebacterium]|uniref:hypothetical protein n=1 Tax=unclassified Corynebacterium TaxID=2624378 RepID=UPI0029C9F886|nr:MULTISPECIES: hypothetical protein [unclassified Corynebacterium]WPF66028.1 hypothetical protein OLX12_10840 [Corynebacterium sp. 22KM0430]WPF68521.1 hypothetical protein OLW90_10835 [Corynebacterium sp. 21KM1197]